MTKPRLMLIMGVLVTPIATPADAQSRHGSRPPWREKSKSPWPGAPPPPRERERPGLGLDRQSYSVADSGRTKVNCYVARQWVPSVEPHCLDEEGSATILPILMRKIEL